MGGRAWEFLLTPLRGGIQKGTSDNFYFSARLHDSADLIVGCISFSVFLLHCSSVVSSFVLCYTEEIGYHTLIQPSTMSSLPFLN